MTESAQWADSVKNRQTTEREKTDNIKRTTRQTSDREEADNIQTTYGKQTAMRQMAADT